MARLPYVDPEHAPAGVAAALRDLPPLNILRMMANAETAFGPWLRYAGAMLNELELDPVLREITILRVAALSPGAEYEWIQHEKIARQIGVTDAQIEGARTGDGLHGDDALVARFTEEVVRDVAPSDATFERASARFSSRELVELVMLIGQYMMVARVMATGRIDLDDALGTGVLDALRY